MAVECILLVLLVFMHLALCFDVCRQKCRARCQLWQWHVAPGFAGIFALRAAFPTIAGRCSVWSLTCPLRTTTWVMVQTVQFPGQGYCYTRCFLRQVQFLGKVVDTPVVFNDRGHGPDSAVPGQVCCFACCFYDSCTWVQTFRKRVEVSQMQFCVAVDVSVTMQRLCGVDGDGAVQGVLRRFTPIFALLFGVERVPISTGPCGFSHCLALDRVQNKHNKHKHNKHNSHFASSRR